MLSGVVRFVLSLGHASARHEPPSRFRATIGQASYFPYRGPSAPPPHTCLTVKHSLLLTLAFGLLVRPASAQALRQIGTTAAGNPVLVESRTVRRDSTLLHSTIRVRFAKPVRTPGGNWWSSRTRLTFDCSRRQVKVLENWYYGDTTWRRVVSHNVVGIPAYGTVLGGSMTSVGYDALCPVK